MPKAMALQPDPRRFATQRAFETWLQRNHASSDGVWLLMAKAGADKPTVTYAEAVEVALCYGWIDGQKKTIDAQHWLQRFTPRRVRSVWSKANRAKAEALIESGRMQPSGLAEIDRARSDGRWDAAYDGARTAVVPSDLLTALDAEPRARAFFAGLDRANHALDLRFSNSGRRHWSSEARRQCTAHRWIRIGAHALTAFGIVGGSPTAREPRRAVDVTHSAGSAREQAQVASSADGDPVCGRVGHSRLMSQDDAATLAALERTRSLFQLRVAAHDGRIVDMAGDSELAAFDSLRVEQSLLPAHGRGCVRTALRTLWESATFVRS